MEDQKYYTPAPEDLRKGFVYERQDQVMPDIWRTNTINQWSKYYIAQSDLANNRVRVPYLTAEQIEAEGWGKRTADGKSYYRTFNGGVWFYLYLRGDNEITIVRESQTEESYHGMVADCDSTKTDLYHGSCRCINDLRLISKLLGI